MVKGLGERGEGRGEMGEGRRERGEVLNDACFLIRPKH